MTNARAKRAKIRFSIVKYANLWAFCYRRRRGCLSSLLYGAGGGGSEALASLSSRRFCHHGRQIAEEIWIDNGVFGAKF